MKKWFVLWFTWLSWAWKTTISKRIVEIFTEKWITHEYLDWDIVRTWLTKDLWFSREDRKKNLERVTFVAKLLSRNNIWVVSAFISPYKEDRDFVKEHTKNFIEVYVNAPLSTCEERDVKWLYKKARSWEILNFTWISDPYEEPVNPDIEVRTDLESIEESSQKVITYLEENWFI